MPESLEDKIKKIFGETVAKEGNKIKTIRFGQQGVKTNQTPKQRKAFKARHAKNIARGKMSGAYWANRVKWSPSKTKRK